MNPLSPFPKEIDWTLCTYYLHSPPIITSSSLESNRSELKHQMREMSNLSATSNYRSSGLRSGSGSGAALLKKQDSAYR